MAAARDFSNITGWDLVGGFYGGATGQEYHESLWVSDDDLAAYQTATAAMSLSFYGMYEFDSDSYDSSGLIAPTGLKVRWGSNDDNSALGQLMEQYVDLESTIVIGFYLEAAESDPLLATPVFLQIFDGQNPTLSAAASDTSRTITYHVAEQNALKTKFGGDYSKTTEEIFMGPIEEMAKDILIEKPNAQITFKSVSYRGFKSKQLSETSKEETQETILTTSLTFTTPTTSY